MTSPLLATSELVETLLWQLRAVNVEAPVREFRFHPSRKWRFDAAWPTLRVAVEVDGGTYIEGRHNRGAGIENDAAKFSEAAALGWRVLRVTRKMVESGYALTLIERALTP
jgi:very-short-patch-repair endonuclease